MKKIMSFLAAGVFLSMSFVSAETITASSDVFTFPPFSGVKNGLIGSHSMYFRCSGVSPIANAVTFAWSVPSQIKTESGTITVYSLVGKAIKTFRPNSRTGSVMWKRGPGEGRAAGMYIVSFSFGSVKQHLKLIINK